jgi:hypothetical protein
MENQVDKSVAEDDFDAIFKAARVKFDVYCAVHGKDGELDRQIIVDAIKDGRITVDENGFPTVHPDTENEKLKNIKIMRRPVRADKLAMDRVKEGHDMGKQDAVLGKFLGVAPQMLGLLEERDYNLLQSLWLIFLGY